MMGNLASTGGNVVFQSHTYNAGEVRIDGELSTAKCIILYVRIYYSATRSIMIGTMVQSEDGTFFARYVQSPTLLINKNIESYWSNWISLT